MAVEPSGHGQGVLIKHQRDLGSLLAEEQKERLVVRAVRRGGIDEGHLVEEQRAGASCEGLEVRRRPGWDESVAFGEAPGRLLEGDESARCVVDSPQSRLSSRPDTRCRTTSPNSA